MMLMADIVMRDNYVTVMCHGSELEEVLDMEHMRVSRHDAMITVNRKQSHDVITAGGEHVCHVSNIFRHNVLLMQLISNKKVITTTIHLNI